MNTEASPVSFKPVEELRADLIKAMKAQRVRLGWLDKFPPFPQNFIANIGQATNHGSFSAESVCQTIRSTSDTNFIKALKVKEGLVSADGETPYLIFFVRQDSHAIRLIPFMKAPVAGWSHFGFMTFTQDEIEMSFGTRGSDEERESMSQLGSVICAVLQTLANHLRTHA
jgi:hypothetical protein